MNAAGLDSRGVLVWLGMLPCRGKPRGVAGPVSRALQPAMPHNRRGEGFLQGRI